MSARNYVRTTEITLEKGKLNFFSTEKSFTESIDNYANAACKIACINKAVKASVAARRTLIEEKLARASKETFINQTALDAEIKALNDEIESIHALASSKIADINRGKMIISDSDTNTYYAYKEYKEGTLSKSEYMHAIGEWFIAHNVKAHIETINAIIADIGKKKASGTQLIKSEGKNFTAVYAKKPYIDLFYSVLADMMAKAGTIKPFNFAVDYLHEQSTKEICGITLDKTKNVLVPCDIPTKSND